MKKIIRSIVRKTRKKWLHINESQENFNYFMNNVCAFMALSVIIISGFIIHE